MTWTLDYFDLNTRLNSPVIRWHLQQNTGLVKVNFLSFLYLQIFCFQVHNLATLSMSCSYCFLVSPKQGTVLNKMTYVQSFKMSRLQGSISTYSLLDRLLCISTSERMHDEKHWKMMKKVPFPSCARKAHVRRMKKNDHDFLMFAGQNTQQ